MTTKDYTKLTLDHPSSIVWDKMIAEIKDIAFILLNKEGLILNWNSGAEAIKGYAASEVIGKSFRIFYTAEDRQNNVPEQLINLATTTGKALHEGWRLRKDGTTFWASIVITALHDEEGEVIGFSKVTRDLTEKKYTEDMLLEKNNALEKMNQELTSFAYVASHDLQEPLRKIQTFASRILEMEKGKFSERGVEYFGRLQSAADRMQTLIQDLLTYSRTTSVERNLEMVSLNDLLESVKTDLEVRIREKHAVIKSSPLPVLKGVKFQFHQLFLNLIGNALKFSKTDVPAQITIQYELVKGDKLKDHIGDPRKNYHYFTITDNGIGFEPEYNNKIFEVFQRLHGKAEYGGTGIGLSICKKIVEHHHGQIWAEGVPDQGATFYIAIPQQ